MFFWRAALARARWPPLSPGLEDSLAARIADAQLAVARDQLARERAARGALEHALDACEVRSPAVGEGRRRGA